MRLTKGKKEILALFEEGSLELVTTEVSATPQYYLHAP